MPNSSYAKSMAQHHVLLIREQLQDMPSVVSEFIHSMDDQYTTLTRLAYILDLKVFFDYLLAESPAFAYKQRVSLTHDDMRLISLTDIEAFPSYLTLYFSQCASSSTTNSQVYQMPIENEAYGKMRKMSTLRAFYKYLFAKNIVDGNLASLVPLPKIRQKPIIYLQPDEVARMLDIAETGDGFTTQQKNYTAHTRKRDIAILSLLLGTGIRVSECVGINTEDINLEENAFLVTRKGGKSMILYFSDEVASALSVYTDHRRVIVPLAGHENAYFLSLQKRRITPRAVEKLVAKYAKIAAPLKRNISPHKLRSTFGTELYRNTGDIYLVADVLGHADVNTTKKHYAAMNEEHRRRAARSVILRDDKPLGQD